VSDGTLYVSGWALGTHQHNLWHFYRKDGVCYGSLCGHHRRSSCGALRGGPGGQTCVACKRAAEGQRLQPEPYRRKTG
jgi:hypothetical protein